MRGWTASANRNLDRDPINGGRRARTMPKGYVLVLENAHDQTKLAAYTEAATPTIIESGARVLAFDGQPTILEGDDGSGQRVVLLEFESVRAAEDWYQSPTYQAAIPLRQAVGDSTVMIVSGILTAIDGE
jgi:uncharacterized protein (DUF1330 family)